MNAGWILSLSFSLLIPCRYQSTWGWGLPPYSSLWKHFCGWNCYLQKIMKPLSSCNLPWLCLHTHALSPLFRLGNLSYFLYSLSCLCNSKALGLSWPRRWFCSLFSLLRCFAGLKFMQQSQMALERIQPLPPHRVGICFRSRFWVEGMAKKWDAGNGCSSPVWAVSCWHCCEAGVEDILQEDNYHSDADVMTEYAIRWT